MAEKKELKHLGVILDGNRRFAKRLMLEPWKGHEYGAEKVTKLVDWCIELNIPQLTLFTFSIENFNRPEEEKGFLFNLFRKLFSDIKNDAKKDIAEMNKKGVRIRFIGRRELFPKDLQEMMDEVEEETENNKKITLNFAMPYGGRAEIIDTIKRMAKSGEDLSQIDEKTLQENLELTDDVDLVIRTSGEKRISGFLLWQAAYAEFYFTPKFWPEFEKQDLITAVDDYYGRERRFGGN